MRLRRFAAAPAEGDGRGMVTGMAIYHFSRRHISRGKGRSATGAAAYRAGLDITDERTRLVHRYGNRQGVADHAILVPRRVPDWTREAASLWNAVEAFEKRKDARVASETILALPHELTLEQNRALVHGYVKAAHIRYGAAAQVDIHVPDAQGDNRNWHAHVLTTDRQLTRNGFREQKPRAWIEKSRLMEQRKLWADHVNHALERAGHDQRVTHKSFKDLGMDDREPTQHLGPEATQKKRKAEPLRILEENAQVEDYNREMEEVKRQIRDVDNAIKGEIDRQRRAENLRRQFAEAGRQDALEREIVQPRQRREALQASFAEAGRHEGQERQAQVIDFEAERERYEEQHRTDKRKERIADKQAELYGIRNAITLRHFDGVRKMEADHGQQTAEKKAALEPVYGRNIRRLEKSIAAARERLERGGFWYGLIFAERDRRTIARDTAGLENARWQEEQAWQPLKNQQREEREHLEKVQAGEMTRTDRWVRKEMEEFERSLDGPAREQDNTREQAQDVPEQGREGLSLGGGSGRSRSRAAQASPLKKYGGGAVVLTRHERRALKAHHRAGKRRDWTMPDSIMPQHPGPRVAPSRIWIVNVSDMAQGTAERDSSREQAPARSHIPTRGGDTGRQRVFAPVPYF